MTKPESVEKMQIVVDSLRSNPQVVVAGGFERDYLREGHWPSMGSGWARTLDIYVHPQKPLYTADELNEFMYGLVPELEPTQSDAFKGGRRTNSDLSLGKLYYDETIGTAALSATVQLNKDTGIVRSGLVTPTWKVDRTINLEQRTWVSVFPDEGHLIDAAENRNTYHIPRAELGRRPGGRVFAPLLASPMLNRTVEGPLSER